MPLAGKVQVTAAVREMTLILAIGLSDLGTLANERQAGVVDGEGSGVLPAAAQARNCALGYVPFPAL